MLEVSDATIRAEMNRAEAGTVLWKIAERLKDRKPEAGYAINECYDLVRHRPSREYHDIYLRVKDYLAGLGLQFVEAPGTLGPAEPVSVTLPTQPLVTAVDH